MIQIWKMRKGIWEIKNRRKEVIIHVSSLNRKKQIKRAPLLT
jgi:hypothetical protein